MSRVGVEANTAVKDAGKAERKPVAQKKVMPGKEKKPSIHERLEINKRIILLYDFVSDILKHKENRVKLQFAFRTVSFIHSS